ncbi:MAG: hypothetical protein L7F77_06180 [Candidatus Magnetominusculus sp. LBB02]|nr:hypothetical protein [Candidatus Magnetominusculus sp. LBB02]
MTGKAVIPFVRVCGLILCGFVLMFAVSSATEGADKSDYAHSVQSDEVTTASGVISWVYAQYITYFGTKLGDVLTSSDGTYYAQWFTNGRAICAWSNGYIYYYNGVTWIALGVQWKTTLSVPSNFKMWQINDGFRLSWDSVSGAASYYIYWGNDDTASSGDLNYAGTLQTSATIYDHTGASSDNVYYYRIKACDSNGLCTSLSDYILMEYGF